MKFSWKIMLSALLLTGCAGARQSTLIDCPKDSAMARGVRDGASSRHTSLSFLQACSTETRAEAEAAYREGFRSSRPKRHLNKEQPAEAGDAAEEAEESAATESADKPALLQLPTPVREPSAVSWVCEVEANSRVFTGVGVTRDEALDSARATCGSHFQSSYCTKADCKQSM